MRLGLCATIGVVLVLGIAAWAFLLRRPAPHAPRVPPKPWPLDYWLERHGFDGFKDYLERDGGYREYSVESHPLLREDVRIVTWIDDSIHPGSFCRALYVEPLERVEDLVPYVRELNTAREAVEYSSLLRQLVPWPVRANNQLLGAVLTLDTEPWLGWWKVSHTGGRFTPSDARRWGIPTQPLAGAFGDGFLVDRPVLLVDKPYAVGPKLWRVVLRREWIGRRGEYRAETLRVLEVDGSPWLTML